MRGSLATVTALAAALAVVAGAGGCGPKRRGAGPPAPPGNGDVASRLAPSVAPLADPGVRLPRDLAISGYELALEIDPAQPTMTGTVTISGALVRATDVVWLHGEGLEITHAMATSRGRQIHLAVVADVAAGKVALRAPAALPIGPTTIAITYGARLAETETTGTFRQRVGDDWYVFTKHEAISARRSFPCLDEPDVKVPWRVTLTVPVASLAVANAPVVADVARGPIRRVTFAATEPLPSYLVAYAVGPFDVVDAGASASGTPHRILTPRGRGADAAYAATIMPRVTTALERWFATPHPFAKLDSIAVPATVGFGAMENPGLITYRESLLLLPPDAGLTRRARLLTLATHEIAHQWFGNLVTPRWWDDLWLNEAFASWLPEQIVGELEPTWRRPEDVLDPREEALATDALATARRVRQPIAGEGDIVTAFDRITYAKGAAILRLFEARLGADRFQAGVRAYLGAHARGNATAADFLAALDAAAPDAGAGAAMATFLDQAGAPRLTATLECPKGGQPAVRLQQTRYAPPGAGAMAAARWTLPVCLRAGTATQVEEACVALADAEVVVPLARCARWVWPNTGGLGYWRVTLAAGGWDALRTVAWKRLSAAERVAVAHDLFAAVAAGEVDVGVGLALVPALLAEDNRVAIGAAVGLLERVEPWLPAAQRPRFAAWIRRQLGARAKALGWLPAPTDDLRREAIRSRVVGLVANVGEDAALRKAAVKLARSWRTLPDAARGDVLVAAVRAEPALADGLLADFRAEPSRALRGDLARGLAAAREPARLAAALALTLDATIDIRDSLAIVTGALGAEATRPAAEAFVLAHLDALLARLPGDTGRPLLGALVGGCDVAAVEARRALVEARFGALVGARRRIDQAFERVSQCAARQAVVAPALATWLRGVR